MASLVSRHFQMNISSNLVKEICEHKTGSELFSLLHAAASEEGA